MKTAIVTGIEPFGPYRFNPTAWLAEQVHGKVISGYKIHSIVLPSEVRPSEGGVDHGETIVRKAQEIGADVIISLGIASEVRGFRIECQGTNWAYNEKYLPKSENDRPLDMARPEKEVLKMDLRPWNVRFLKRQFEKAGLPLERKISDDAGKYSCNSIIYRTLLAKKRRGLKTPFLFVHVSCTPETVRQIKGFDERKHLNKKEDLLTALEIILRLSNPQSTGTYS
ncbi:MAG: hypothetical protein AABW54_00665 [Candidatus Micrarchaeota archaeon]